MERLAPIVVLEIPIMLQEQLTKKQQVVFDFIRSRIEQDGYGPTIREIASEMGFSSPNGVVCHLTALEKKGLIHRSSHKSRSIVLTEQVHEEISGLPLAGRVAAGGMMEAIEQQERVDLGELWSDQGTFLLEVSGDSMIDAHIQEGDYVVVQKRRTASKGDIAVVRNSEGEATLKYWYPEKNRIRLQPANASMKPKYTRDAKVVGVVVGVVRPTV